MLTLSQVSFSLGAAYTKPFWIIFGKRETSERSSIHRLPTGKP